MKARSRSAFTRSHGTTGPKLDSTLNAASAIPSSEDQALAAEHAEAVQRQHAGDPGEHAGAVGGDDGERVVAAVEDLLARAHAGEVLGRREVVAGHVLEPAPGEDVRGPLDELGDEARLPAAPRRRAGRQRVGLGERGEQLEGAWSPTALATRSIVAGVVEVATGGDVGQQQVVPDHGDERVDVVGAGTPSAGRHRLDAAPCPPSVWSPGCPLPMSCSSVPTTSRSGTPHPARPARRRRRPPRRGAGRR